MSDFNVGDSVECIQVHPFKYRDADKPIVSEVYTIIALNNNKYPEWFMIKGDGIYGEIWFLKQDFKLLNVALLKENDLKFLIESVDKYIKKHGVDNSLKTTFKHLIK